MSNVSIERQIVEWFLTVNRRFSPHFYHWVIILWDPVSPIDWRAGKRKGAISLIRSNAFQSQDELSEYLIYYNTFLKKSEKISFANYVFREVATKQIYIVTKGSRWKFEEKEFNSVIGKYSIHIQIPTNSVKNSKKLHLKSQNDEIYDEIFGTKNYPFYPYSPLIVTRHSIYLDLFIVNISDYPIFENLVQDEECENDFEDFYKALVSNSFICNNFDLCILDKNDEKIQNIYKGLKILRIIPEWRTILFVPVPIMKVNGGEIVFVGVVVFSRLTYKDIQQHDFNELDTIITSIYAIGRHLSFRQAIDLSTRQVKYHALCSAIAAIMARNMSHNIGSHAIWHLAEGLKDSGAYSNPQIEDFLRYLQRRMDFIAQVSTSAPSWCLTMNLLELFGGFFRQICLLDNIARTHLAKSSRETIYGKKLLISWKYKNATLRMRIADGDNHWECNIGEVWVALEDLRSLRDTIKGLSIDIPHGHVGAQAFYCIMENLIRNAAKFGNRKKDESLEFTILVQDEQDDWGYENPKWKEEFYKVSIFDNLPTIPSTVDTLNGYLAADIIEPTGEVKPGQWGMKEIKICAAYLRLVRPEDIDPKYREWKDGKGEKPPLVEYKLSDSGNLTCVLYLLRPKEALLVGKRFRSALNKEELFRQQGIDILDSFTQVKQEVEAGTSYRHHFLVVDDEQDQVDWQWLERYVNCLPYRIIVVGEIPSETQLQIKRTSVSIEFKKIENQLKNSPQALMDFLWEKWVNTWWNQFRVVARIKEDNDMRSRIDEFVRSDSEMPDALVFDHDWEGQDQSKLYQSAPFHWSLRRRGDDSAYVQLISGNRWRIKETAAVTVAILDERVFMERERMATYGVDRYSEQARSLEKAWKKKRVYLLDDHQALENFSKFVEMVREIICQTGCEFFDFLVIHQGIIDEIKKRQGQQSFEQGWCQLKNLFRWVVVDTGRGEPEQAKIDRLRWVEYSNIAECLIQGAADKFRLVQLLFALQANPSSWRDVT